MEGGGIHVFGQQQYAAGLQYPIKIRQWPVVAALWGQCPPIPI